MLSVEPRKNASKLELKLREELKQARKKEKYLWSLWQVNKDNTKIIVSARKYTEDIEKLLKRIRTLEKLK